MCSCGRIYVAHVSGKRMIVQGTDSVSRGQLREGVSIGKAMFSYCPWTYSALDQFPTLFVLVKLWSTSECQVLIPKDWFIKAHDINGLYKDKRKVYRPQIKQGV
mmetsp:Transcript_8221/g.11747  ORF Transcript_8221/g.11747 Transcript_8221/m.11747 type:complete len:104 (+) Transcript_8221:242-553(+)